MIKNWNNGKNEMFRGIPVVCPNCKEQVAVTGYLEEGELRLESCPKCEEPFSLEVRRAAQEEVQEAPPPALLAKAAVNWFLEGAMLPQVSAVVGPTSNMLVLMANVINTAVMFYMPGAPQKFHGAIAKFMLENFVAEEDTLQIMDAILEGFSNRKKQAAQEKNTNNPVLTLDDILNPKTDPDTEEESEMEDDES